MHLHIFEHFIIWAGTTFWISSPRKHVPGVFRDGTRFPQMAARYVTLLTRRADHDLPGLETSLSSVRVPCGQRLHVAILRRISQWTGIERHSCNM